MFDGYISTLIDRREGEKEIRREGEKERRREEKGKFAMEITNN